MTNEKNADLTASNEELDEQVEELEKEEVVKEDDNLDVLKEKLEKVQEQNKKLFSRTKRAEGFVKDDSGKWVKKPVEQEKPEIKEAPATSQEIEDKKFDERLDAKLEKRELSNFDISDSLKKEVGAYAKLNDVSVKEALVSPYIKFRLDEEESADITEEASLGGGKGKTAKRDIGQIGPGDFDLKTEQGKKDFKAWEEKVKKELG